MRYMTPAKRSGDAAGIVEWIFHLLENNGLTDICLEGLLKFASAHAGIKTLNICGEPKKTHRKSNKF